MADPGDRERKDPRADTENPEGLSNLALAYQSAGPYISASTTLVVAVAGGALGGYWVDGKLHNAIPWFFLGGVTLGMVVGFVGFFKTVMKAGKKK